MTLPGLTDVQTGEAPLPAGETWTNPCPSCHLVLQGGLDGLRAHQQTVHPTQEPRLPL